MMDDTEPCRLVVSEILRAKRWKFCEDILLRLGSESGSGVPVREGGEFKFDLNVTAGAWDCDGVLSECC